MKFVHVHNWKYIYFFLQISETSLYEFFYISLLFHLQQYGIDETILLHDFSIKRSIDKSHTAQGRSRQ